MSGTGLDGLRIRRATTPELTATDLAQMLDLFHAYWPEGEFTPDDVAHAMGGVHWLAGIDGLVIGHAAVVPRELEVGGEPLPTGYVEAVATLPAWQRLGIATRLMTLAGEEIRVLFDLGALSAGVRAVYAGLGWERWRGPTFVRTDAGPQRTAEEDAGIMVLRTSRTPPLRLDAWLSCEWRRGDCW